MTKTLICRFLKTLAVMVVLLFSTVTSALSQNLIVNGDFEQLSGFDYGAISDYERVWSGGVHEGHFIHDVTSNGHGVGTVGWPSNLTGYGGSGYYLLFNGFGGSVNPTKAAWRQTVAVTTNTTYTFTAQVRNLAQGFMGMNPNPAILRLKINNQQVGSDLTLPTNNNWTTWTITWHSNSATQAVIEIVDAYTGQSSQGDDFGIDHISFVPDVLYSVDANDDSNISVCLNVYQDIDVLANDIVTPNSNDATVTVVTNPAHGTAVVQTNKKIRYTFTGGNYTTDQLKYRVTTHGVYDEAWVYINTNQPPVVANISAPGPICAGDPLGISTPSVNPNVPGHWEQSTTSGGSFTQFDPSSIPFSMNGHYVRYSATNDCGEGHSNAVQIQVSDEPVIGTPATPQAICAGNSFNLTTPSIQNNGSAIISQGWQIAATQNGTYNTFNNESVPYSYNGYWIRYFAENDCGLVYSASVQITVNDTPIVGSITAPAGICAGQSFNLTTPSVTWRHVNQGTGSWEIQVNGVWQTLNNNNIPFSYNGCSIRYKAHNGCGDGYSTNNVQVIVYSTDPINEGEITACDAIYHHGVLCNHNGNYVFDSITPNGCTIQVSWHFTLGEAYVAPVQYEEACDSYYWPKTHQTYYETNVYDITITSPDPQVCDSTFTLDLTINHAPQITSNLQMPSDICAGSLLNVNAPAYQMNHSGGGTTRWEYATSQSGPFHPFDPTTYHLDYGSYYLRFAVVNGCDSVFSNVVPFYVNDQPIISGQLMAMQVCEGHTLDLPEVSVEWKNFDTNDRFSEWQMAASQNGIYSGFNPSVPMQMSQNGYWVRFLARNSCGEVVLGPVRITVMSSADVWLETITACDSYYWPHNGQTYYESQTVEYEEEEPCLHTVYQPIVINHSDYVVEPITSCHDNYEWHGMIFHRSDEMQYAWDTLINLSGCDSVVELQLDFGAYSTYTHNRTACGSYEWEMNPGHIYYETVRDSVFVPATGLEDCDTWYYLELVVGHDTEVEGEPMTECRGFVWHGVTYYNDAVVYDSLQTAVTHCDSIVSHQLTIIQPYHTEDEMTKCQPFWWYEHYCDHDGDFEHTFQSIEGCDSIVTLHFSLGEYIVHEFDTLACEGFEWYGNSCTESGHTYSHVFQTPQGCDSLVKMHVTLNVMQMFTQFVSACDSIEMNGVMYNQPGNYYIYGDTLHNQNGCDSIIYRINLTVRNSDMLGVIEGSHEVYAASNLVNGVYRYDIDTTGIISQVSWTIDNPDWQVIEQQLTYCRVLVATPGSAVLKASFQTSSCGQMEKQFEIHAGFFGIEEHGIEVNVYPNPTKGNVTIEAEGIESVRLTNMIGQTLDWRECDRNDSLILDLHGYAPSVYLLEIKTINGLVKKRVVVCR